jgi:hypothetical protein
MKLLSEAMAATMTRLKNIDNGARTLVLELDGLDIRLHRAFTALCIDGYVTHLNVERKQMLKDEERAATGASLIRLPALGAYGLFSFLRGQKPDWEWAAGSILRDEPYGDIRVAGKNDDVKLINVSGIARGRGTAVAQVVAYLEQTGYAVLSWPEFEARAENLRMAALKGEANIQFQYSGLALPGDQKTTHRQ